MGDVLTGTNWVDGAILLLLLFYLFEGWGRGLLLGLIDLVGFLLSFIIALKGYALVGSLLVSLIGLSQGFASAAGFLICGIAVEMLFSFLINIFYRYLYFWLFASSHDRAPNTFMKIDKTLGFIPALGEGIIFCAFILTLLVTLPVQGSVKKDVISSRLGGELVGKTQGIEHQLNAVFGEAVNDTLTFLTVNPSAESDETVNLGFTQPDTTVDQEAEQKMLELVNYERQKAGLPVLQMDSELRTLARTYAKDLFARGYFSHHNPEGQSPFDRMEEANISFLAAGENLALAPNVTLAHQGLMNSPGHRANILSEEYGHVGIGVMDGGMYGQMFVQEFTD